MLIIMVLLIITMPLFVSCGKTGGDKSKTEGDVSFSGDESFPYSGNFGGKTIKIFTISSDRNAYGELQFVSDEDSKAGAVNQAVNDRNNRIEEDYGLKIAVTSAKYPADDVKTLIQGGVCEYDVVVDSVDKMVTSVTENLYRSLDDIIDLGNKWWDNASINSLTLNDKHYFLAGDALITDDDNIYLTLFNKDMYNNNNQIKEDYGDIYKLVNDGKFTYDAFLQMSKSASKADPEGKWTFDATYGNLSHAYGATIMVNGAGIALAEKLEDNIVRLNPGTEKAVTVFDKVYEIMSDKTITQRAELIIGQGSRPSTYGFSELEEMFRNGRGLFYNTTSSSISILKYSTEAIDFQFGVLPIPKFDEEQEHYYCAVNRYQSSVIGIPSSNVENTEETAFLLEALGYFSEDVTEAYYETTLKLQAIEDDDDAKMLDLIYNNRFYDIGAIYGWGGTNSIVGLYSNVIKNDSANTLISSWEAIKSAVEEDMNATIEEYQNNLN